MAKIKALRSLLEPRAGTSREAMEMARAQVAEAQAYKAELETIHAALQRSQRVGTVVETLAFLEEHLERLMEIWHHVEQLKPVVFDEPTDVDKKLLNGPKLAGDAGHSSQNDIDSLFDS
jgi:chemotaxis protein CheZ